MKKIFLFVLAVSVQMACNSPVKGPNGVTYKTAVEYNEYIIGRQTTLIKKIMTFSKTAETDLEAADQLLDQYARDATVMINEIKGMPPYRTNTGFRDAAVRSFTFYRKLFDDFYKDIVRIRMENAPDAGQQIQKIVKKLSDEEKMIDNNFQNAQEQFARKNNLRLKDNVIQDKIDEMK